MSRLVGIRARARARARARVRGRGRVRAHGAFRLVFELGFARARTRSGDVAQPGSDWR